MKIKFLGMYLMFAAFLLPVYFIYYPRCVMTGKVDSLSLFGSVLLLVFVFTELLQLPYLSCKNLKGIRISESIVF